MARILNAESQRQMKQGARPFSKRERPAAPANRRYLVVGGYIKEGEQYSYMTPRKLCQIHGIDPAQAQLFHPGTAEPQPAQGNMILVDIEGVHLPESKDVESVDREAAGNRGGDPDGADGDRPDSPAVPAEPRAERPKRSRKAAGGVPSRSKRARRGAGAEEGRGSEAVVADLIGTEGQA